MKKKRILPFILSALLMLGTVPAAAEEENTAAGTENQEENTDASASQGQETVPERDPNLPDSYYEPVATNSLEGWPEGPAVWADAAVVMDCDTGSILYSKNMDKQEYPASITKLMTILLAIENSDPQERVPGAAGVVRRAKGGERELGRERIVEAAMRVADHEGLAALSMRRVATELGVATMSLYRHVPGKDELLRLMTDRVFGEQPLAAAPAPDWRTGLEEVSRLQWRIYRSHPWLASTMSFTRPVLAPDAALHTERAISALAGLGLSWEEMAQASVSLAAFTCGLAVHFEREAQAEQDSGMSAEEWMERLDDEDRDRLMSDPERFPMFDALNRGPEIDLGLDALFEFGLARMLDGVGVLIAARGGATG